MKTPSKPRMGISYPDLRWQPNCKDCCKNLDFETYQISDGPTRFWMGLWLSRCPRDVLWRHSIPRSSILRVGGSGKSIRSNKLRIHSSKNRISINNFFICLVPLQEMDGRRRRISDRFHLPERACSNGTQSGTLSGTYPKPYTSLKRDQNAQKRTYPRV